MICVKHVIVMPLVTFMLCGCGGASDGLELHPVKGTVYVDGNPAAGAEIVFFEQDAHLKEKRSPTPKAVVGTDGTFEIGSFDSGDGAQIGKYVVTVIWLDLPPTDELGHYDREAIEKAQDRLRGKYATRDRSELVVEVKEGINELVPFELTAKKSSRARR